MRARAIGAWLIAAGTAQAVAAVPCAVAPRPGDPLTVPLELPGHGPAAACGASIPAPSDAVGDRGRDVLYGLPPLDLTRVVPDQTAE